MTIQAHVQRPRCTSEVLAILNAWPRHDFEYGTADCCQLAGFVARELTGHNYLAGVEYASEAEAGEILRRSGGLSGALSDVLGEPAPISALTPGDIVLVRWRDLELAGVYLGTSKVAGIDMAGNIVEIPLKLCPFGWRLPWPA